MSEPNFVFADNHKKAIEQINNNTKRITNTRYRKIERMGQFYFVEDQAKNGKTLIFESI